MAHPTPHHRVQVPMAHPTLQRRVAADLTAAVNLTPAAADPMAPTTKSVTAESGSACCKSGGV